MNSAKTGNASDPGEGDLIILIDFIKDEYSIPGLMLYGNFNISQ